MPRIRIDASPSTLTIDRGENPVMGGLTQGLHSLWEGQNRAAEINRQGSRDRDQQAMQLWERQHGDKADQRQDLEFLQREGDSDKARERQTMLDQAHEDQRGIENERKGAEDTHLWDYQGKEASARERAAEAAAARAASYDKMVAERWGAGGSGAGGMNEREAWKQAEVMAQHEAIDEFGKPKAVDPTRVQAIHDHLMQRGAPAGGGAGVPAGDPQAPLAHDLQDFHLWGDAGRPDAVPAPAAPVAGVQPQLWGNAEGAMASHQEKDGPIIESAADFQGDDSPPPLAAAQPVENPRRQAFLELAGGSAPADESLLADMLSDDPAKVQGALQTQYRGRPDHLKVAVAALRHIHGGGQAKAAVQPAPAVAAPPAAEPPPSQPAHDPLWDDPTAAGF